jgi:hypothetical protein
MMFYIWEDVRVYILSTLGHHPIWHDIKRWKKSINHSIETRLLESEESERRKAEANRPSLFGTLGSIWKNTSNLIFSYDPVQAAMTENDKAVASTAFLITTQYNYYFLSLGLPFNYAAEMLLKVSHRYNMTNEQR